MHFFLLLLVPSLQKIQEAIHIFQHPEIKEGDIQVYLGDQILLKNSSPPFTAGQFKIISANTIDLIDPGVFHGTVPLRIMIRGIESEPKWITLP